MSRLFNASAFQVIFSVMNRAQGLAITALIYRIFDLGTIGEYFFLQSIFALLISIQQLGASKILIKDYLAKNNEAAHLILTARYITSFAACGLFFLFVSWSHTKISLVDILLLGICLPISILSPDWALMARQRFSSLGAAQTAAQLVLLLLLILAYFKIYELSIAVHQLAPTLILMGFTLVMFRRDKPMAFLLPRFSTLSVTALARTATANWFLLFSAAFISSINVFDYVGGKIYLNEKDIGILAGLLRMASLAFGLMIALNTIFYSFGLADAGSSRNERINIMLGTSLVSVLLLAAICQPYFTLIMTIENITVDLAVSYAFVVIGVAIMPAFFYFFGKLEVSKAPINLKKFSCFLCISAAIYASALLAPQISGLSSAVGLSYVCGLFTFKWAVLTIAFWKLSNEIQH